MEGHEHVLKTESKLGHIAIEWKISYFTFFSSNHDFTLRSPLLQVQRPEETTWQVVVSTYTGANAKNLVFEVHRMDSRRGVVRVSVNWRLRIECAGEPDVTIKKGDAYLYKTFYFRCELPYNTLRFRDTMGPFLDDTLLIQLNFIVIHSEYPSIQQITDERLKLLSSDLLALYERGDDSDAVITGARYKIPAHKAILQLRSPYFKHLLEQDQQRGTFELKEFVKLTVNKMLSYLYSGQLKFVLEKPTVSMYDCAALLQIEEVKSLYAFDHIFLESKTDVENVLTQIRISDFKFDREYNFKSDIFGGAFPNMTLRFIVGPIFKDSDEVYVSVTAEVSSSVEMQKIVCIEAGFLNRRNELVFVNKGVAIVELFSTISLFQCRSLILTNSEILHDGTLCLYAKIGVSDLHALWVTTLTDYTPVFSTSEEFENPYMRLSTDMASLVKNPLYSDITLVSEGINFHLHKCIINARSFAFQMMVKEWNSVLSNPITFNIKSQLFSALVDYLYIGILKDISINDVLEIYETAYTSPFIQMVCCLILRENLTVENVRNVLTCAEKMGDTELKNAALKFICCNRYFIRRT